MRLLRLFAVLVLGVLVAPANRQLGAQQSSSALTRLYIHTGPEAGFVNWYGALRYGGNNWQALTALLQGTFDVTTGANLPSMAVLDQYDALWIDQRYGSKPTATDLSTMQAFAASGRRIVIVGENSYPHDLGFFNWSAPFVAALGGSQPLGNATIPAGSIYAASGGCVYGGVNTIFAHALTVGVHRAEVGCAGFAVGGTPLFDYNVATLWGAPQNVLTILDTNILDDYFGNMLDSPQFRENVVSWLDQSAVTTVPEPATYAMLVPALLAIGVAVRRRARPA